jgi:predicted nucleotidyltransferase
LSRINKSKNEAKVEKRDKRTIMPRIVKKTSVQPGIDRSVKRIVKQFYPQQVILFGSHARGEAGPDSDVDLLVVMDFEGIAHEKGLEILQALPGSRVALDVIATRPEDYAWQKDVVGTIEWPAAGEGRDYMPVSKLD